MCSIMGYCGSSAAYDVFLEGFQRTISRGPDDTRIVDTGKGFLGFHRHLRLWGLAIRGCSLLSWMAAMWSATARFMALKKWREKLRKKG